MKKTLLFNGASLKIAVLVLVALGIFTQLDAQTKLEGSIVGHEGSWDGTNGLIFDAFDGDVNTFIDGPPTIGWVGYDFGETDVPVIASWKYAPREGWANRMNGTQLRGSNNPNFHNIYTVLYTIEADPTEGELTEAMVNASQAYRFVYWYGGGYTYSNIAEFQLFDTDGQVMGTQMGQEESWDGVNGFPAAAFDGDVTTFVDGAEGFGWAGYDFGEGNEAMVTSWKYAPRLDWAFRLPGTQLRGSNHPNYLNNYTVLDTIVAEPEVGVLTESTVESTEAYRWVYWYGPKGSYANIAELEVYGMMVNAAEDQIISNDAISIFPNPTTTGSFNIQLNDYKAGKTVNVKIYTLAGQEVYNANMSTAAKTIEVTHNLNAGMYIVRVGNNAVEKLMVY